VRSRYPIMYRIDLSLALNATYPDKWARWASATLQERADHRHDTGLYANLVHAGWISLMLIWLLRELVAATSAWPHATRCYLPLAKTAKDYLAHEGIKSEAGFEVPVVAVGKLGYPDLAERALREGQCDMIMLARRCWPTPNGPGRPMPVG